MSRNSAIDAQRGFAVLAVMQHHLFGATGAYTYLGLPLAARSVLDLGWAGVDLFFVLSAYLLTSNLLKYRNCQGLTVSFYKRRALRILPLYWALVVSGFGGYALWRALGGTDDVALWHNQYPLWVYLGFLQNIAAGLQVAWVALFYAPTWSLAVEEHFYLVLPWFAARLQPQRLVYLAIAGVVTAPLIRIGLGSYVSANAAYCWSIARIDCFGWGMLLALTPRMMPGAFETLAARIDRRWLATGAALAAILIAQWPEGLGITPEHHTPNALALTFTAMLASLVTLAAITPAGRQPKASPLSWLWRGFVWCGERCYSLYLFHMPVLGLIFLLAGAAAPSAESAGGLILASSAFALTLALSGFTFAVVEQPFMVLADRIAPYRGSASRTAAQPSALTS